MDGSMFPPFESFSLRYPSNEPSGSLLIRDSSWRENDHLKEGSHQWVLTRTTTVMVHVPKMSHSHTWPPQETLQYKRVNLAPSVMKVKLIWSCLTLCDPIDYIIHGILQGRIQECVAFPFTSSQPRDQTWVSHIAGGFFTSRATREAQEYWNG